MKLIEGFDSNYRYVLVAARRARQLQNGARPVVETHSRKACRIAEEEINAGKVKWVIPAPSATPVGRPASRSQDRWAAKRTTSSYCSRSQLRCCDDGCVRRERRSSRWIDIEASFPQIRHRMSIMKIALGVSGGIAAYKAAEIVRLLQDRGVRCRS